MVPLNPLRWKPAQQVDIAIGLVVGIASGLFVAYLRYAWHNPQAASLARWLEGPAKVQGFLWCLAGAVIGALFAYGLCLLRGDA